MEITNNSDLLADILATIRQVPQNNAFVIEDKAYTYKELGSYIAAVYQCI